MSKQDMLDVVHNETDAMQVIAMDMDELSRALMRVGNYHLADEIQNVGVRLVESQNNIRDAVHKDISEQVNNSMVQVGKTFSALLEKTG